MPAAGSQKMKVSILNIRRHIPELNCMSPVYATEVPHEKLVSIIRNGFVVVDAADLTPIGLDATGEAPKKITAAPAAATPVGGSSPSGSPAAPSGPAGGGTSSPGHSGP